jgi:hypothetical protein
MEEMNFSARAQDRILKVARALTDLVGSPTIRSNDILEAIQYRSLDRKLFSWWSPFLMKIITPIFEEREIRRLYDEKTETWFFSVVEIVQVLTHQPDLQTSRKWNPGHGRWVTQILH